MDQLAYLRYRQLMERIETDEEYQFLQEQMRQQQPEFMEVLGALQPGQREIILNFLGICGEIGERRVEYACQLP